MYDRGNPKPVLCDNLEGQGGQGREHIYAYGLWTHVDVWERLTVSLIVQKFLSLIRSHLSFLIFILLTLGGGSSSKNLQIHFQYCKVIILQLI